MSRQEIVRNLADNTADIIADCEEGHPERLSALAHRQKSLTEALNGVFPHEGAVSPAEVKGLQDLVKKAMDAVTAEMGMNRGSMQATGIKKKMLSAYGTVTVSNTPSR